MNLTMRVKAGAAFLDAKYGRKLWRKKIDVDTLDLSLGYSCILGQTDGNYNTHRNALGLDDDSAATLGFFCSETDYRRLTLAWKRYLRKK